MRRRRERQEPVLDTFGSLFDLKLNPDDRAGGAPRAETSRGARGAPKHGGNGRNGAGGQHGKAKRPRRRWRRLVRRIKLRPLAYWGSVLAVWTLLALLGAFVWLSARLPSTQALTVPERPPTVTILGADGTALATRGETGGAAVPLKALPPYLPQAFVAIEDRRFHSHFGLDLYGLARAAFANLAAFSIREGGSTITQQLAKNLYLSERRTLARKVEELVLALWLEAELSKDEILELYLNRVYFGAGAYGVEAAAQRYFGKPARLVTLAEAAMLAGLVKAPSRLAPTRNLAGARERAELVLAAMVEEGFITDEMARTARAHAPTIVQREGPGAVGYVADWVMDQLDDYVGRIERDILVQTTIDPALQAAAEQALTDELAAKGERFGVRQGALLAMDPNGAVRALVGGRAYGESQFNRAVAARRQPGSAFKPFVYLAALERGLTPDTVREDAPVEVAGWRPENYGKKYYGPVTLTTALSHSLNTVAVRVGLEVGAPNVVRTARRLGIASKLEANASIALGTSEVTLLELVTAYAPFANGGIGVTPHVIERVRAKDGRIVYARASSGRGRVVAPVHVAMMNRMLMETLLTGTAHRAELPGWPAAGKTGTSQDFRDAWFVGYTGRLVAGVWLGNDDNAPTRRASGSNLPVDIWNRFMREAHRGLPVIALPGNEGAPAIAPAPAVATGPPATASPVPPFATAPSAVATIPPAQRMPVEDGPAPGVPAHDDAPLDRWLLDRLFGRR